MIQTTLEAVAGWQQFVSPAEVVAAAVALVIGWFGTELLKRITQLVLRKYLPAWVWVGLGFAITFGIARGIWPATGLFPHPWVAALTVAVASPTIYAALIWALRRAGLGGLASIITGNRRKKNRTPRIERRRW